MALPKRNQLSDVAILTVLFTLPIRADTQISTSGGIGAVLGKGYDTYSQAFKR
jgi:hypothetical protein